MKITIYRNGNDGGLSIEDGESEADVTRVIMQSAVSFVVGSVPSDLNNTQKEEIVRNFAKSAELEMRLALSCWCGQIALHELWGLGRTRLDRITRRKELLGSLKGTEVRV